MMKQEISSAMKDAMRSKDKDRLGVIRLIQAAIKQKEVDERVEVEDSEVIAILDKMLKQRRESIKQYESANRSDLAEKESFEIKIIQDFLPSQLSNEEIISLINTAIEKTEAKSMKDMGQVMAVVRPEVQGRADVAAVSALVREKLSSLS